MFDFLRVPSRKRNFVVYTVFGLISLVFVFMGTGDFLSSSGVGGFAAVVNDERISIYEYRSEYRQRERFYSQIFKGNLNQMQLAQLKQAALENLIQQEILAQAVQDQGLKLSDVELAKTIMSFPAFQDNGIFNKALYQQYLSSQRLSAFQFEKSLRRSLLNQKASDLFSISLMPSAFATELEAKIDSRKMNVEFVDLTTLPAKALAVSKNEVAEYIKNNEEDLKKEYSQRQSEFSSPEQVKARHILVRIDSSNAESEKNAFEKVKKIKSELTVENFSDLAKKYSDDPGSKDRGGQLGYFGREAMVSEFSDAAFKLSVGEISPPVKSNFGYHLIYVEDKKAATTKDFTEVSSKLAEEKLKQEKEMAVQDKLGNYLANGNYAKLGSELRQLGLKWEESGLFSLGSSRIPKLGEVSAFVETAFTLDKKSQYPKSLVRDANRVFLVRYKAEKLDKVDDSKNLAKGNAQMSSRELLDRFTRELQESAKIERNPRVLEM